MRAGVDVGRRPRDEHREQPPRGAVREEGHVGVDQDQQRKQPADDLRTAVRPHAHLVQVRRRGTLAANGRGVFSCSSHHIHMSFCRFYFAILFSAAN